MSDNSFPRAARVLSAQEYQKVFSKPVRVSARGMLILAVANEQSRARLGLVVPKKVLRSAVDRNRIKRLVRESFRNNQHALPDADLVFIAKPHIGDLGNHELFSALGVLWGQISNRLHERQSG